MKWRTRLGREREREGGLGDELGDAARQNELYCLGRQDNPIRQDTFFSYKLYGSPTQDEEAETVFGARVFQFSGETSGGKGITTGNLI